MNKIQIVGLFLNLIIYLIMVFPIIIVCTRKKTYSSLKTLITNFISITILEIFLFSSLLTQLLHSILLTQKDLNPSLDIEGVLLTMLDSRTILGLEVVEEIKAYFKEKVYDTIIPRLIKLSEAPSHGKPILAYDPKNRGTVAYLNLAKEVIDHNGN